jgi:hypothetical protein
MSSPRGIAGRDQGVSAFSAILGRLCDATGAAAVALVDDEGETVDYTGSLVPYDVKVMAAEMALVLRQVQTTRSPVLASAQSVLVRGSQGSFWLQPLTLSYALVLQMPRRSFGVSLRALAEAVHEICSEAQLPLPAHLAMERWARVEVQEHRSHRPQALWMNGKWSRIEVLGQWSEQARSRREMGYRARVASGEEVTLVREKRGLWFVDDSSQLGSLR